MKVLAIEASPRKGGITTKLLDELLTEVEKQGHTIERVRVSDLKIAPCRGCLVCRKKGSCVVQDDIQMVHEKMNWADTMIVASPTYWANMPSSLKCLFDRSVFVFQSFATTIPQPRMKGKKAVILTACGSPFPVSHMRKHGGAGAARNIANVLTSGGFSIDGRLIRPGASRDPEVSQKDLEKVRRLGQRLF